MQCTITQFRKKNSMQIIKWLLCIHNISRIICLTRIFNLQQMVFLIHLRAHTHNQSSMWKTLLIILIMEVIWERQTHYTCTADIIFRQLLIPRRNGTPKWNVGDEVWVFYQPIVLFERVENKSLLIAYYNFAWLVF